MQEAGAYIDSLMAQFAAPLRRRIRLMMGARARDQAESVDFLQQVFLVAFQNADTLRALDQHQQLRWLTRTARNRVHQSVRKHREQALATLTASVSKLLPAASSAHEPPRRVDQQEQIERLVDVLQELTDDHQLVIELRDFDGLSFREIGERMQRTESAAQMLHARAMVKLAEALKRSGSSRDAT